MGRLLAAAWKDIIEAPAMAALAPDVREGMHTIFMLGAFQCLQCFRGATVEEAEATIASLQAELKQSFPLASLHGTCIAGTDGVH